MKTHALLQKTAIVALIFLFKTSLVNDPIEMYWATKKTISCLCVSKNTK